MECWLSFKIKAIIRHFSLYLLLLTFQVYKIDEIIEEKPCITCNVKPPEEVPPKVEDPSVTDVFEDLSFNADARSSLQPSGARASSFLVSTAHKTSIQEAGLQPCECFKEESYTINSSIKSN